MAGKVGHLKIFGYDFTFVFRHRFEKEDDDSLMDKFTMWNEWELGFFYKRMSVVSRKRFQKIKEWDENLVYMYMLGINFLWFKAWFTVDKGAMRLGEK
jgi:hypothetical protein